MLPKADPEVTPIIILAGGRSRRMGRDKLLLEFMGETLINRAYRRFSEEFERVYISIAGAGAPPGFIGGAERVIEDIHPGLGPVSGLHAALTRFDSAFLVAADMPLAEPRAARELINKLPGYAAAAARSLGRTEPLFAAYSKAALPAAEVAIASGDHSLHRLLARVTARYVETRPETLLNVNFPEDYARLIGLKT
ncbi:MAG: molybdenum cofactor guanylyltransferase [Oscillospiraceae bacterium]|nr:molybdenum cofactor guanylyltransferase [Oscillospiraceae bacterium]